MLVSELKPTEEILASLEGEKNIFLVGCKGCAEACETGGEKDVLEMKEKLEKEGKNITGYTVIDFLCEKALVISRLAAKIKQVEASNSLLVLSCGIGIQATSAVVDKLVHPGCNTISLGGVQGKWRGSERCQECGDCLLDYTGGICPMTACTKSLINGGCGGAKDGKCEFEPEVRDCGWILIYERLKKLNQLERMKKIIASKNFARVQPPKDLRSTIIWDLDQEEKGKEAVG